MRPEMFGDSYDFVKRSLIHGLARPREWEIHPMYFDLDPLPEFVRSHAGYLGVDVVAGEGDVASRDDVVAVGSACRNHLLLDPDTGIWTGDRRPNGGWNRHLSPFEIEEIATAPGREDLLTLVFDQSYTRANDEDKMGLVEAKLDLFNLHSAAYVSHAVFIWFSQSGDLVTDATRRLLRESGLPDFRVVQHVCDQHHIGM